MHGCGLFHRDLYLCHVMVEEDTVRLIDLQRVCDDPFFKKHRRIKDLAALLYSSLNTQITRTDRMRFFKIYHGGGALNSKAKRLIKAVENKTKKIHAHNQKHR